MCKYEAFHHEKPIKLAIFSAMFVWGRGGSISKLIPRAHSGHSFVVVRSFVEAEADAARHEQCFDITTTTTTTLSTNEPLFNWF